MKVYQRRLKPKFNPREQGAAIIMAYLAILMFLFMAVLFLDIPYMERVSRTIQRAADGAALAGAVQLSRRTSLVVGEPQIGWIFAKRAVFAFLNANPIAGAEGLTFVPPFPVIGTIDTLDTAPDAATYQYENFKTTTGLIKYDITVTRGVYDRPDPWDNDNSGRQQIFFPVELPVVAGGNRGPGDTCRTKANNGALTAMNPNPLTLNSYPVNVPVVCDPFDLRNLPTLTNILNPTPGANPPVLSVADSVSVTITISGIPTLFAKLFQISSFADITRTGISVPQ